MKKNIDQIIEEAFKVEPSFKLGADFKDRVTTMIKKRERRSQRRFYLLISLGVLVMFGAGAGVIQYFGSFESLSQFNKVVPIAIMLGGVVAIVQYLDKKLVKDKFLRQMA